ncbi:DUF4349 domain-containing protein [Actinophytocola sp. NPDC049390]|uniref:DUF4349 domain-containing protein n=1 Tax=Actinophytocola sp. NPDC049390 TaxID=3363894 RepID=UPI00378AEC07
MKHRLVGAAAMLGIAAALVTACTAGSGSTADGAAAPAPYEAESAGGAGEPRSTGAGEKPAATAKKEISQPGVDRKLVRTATMELVATDVVATVDRARDVAVRENGYAGREQVRDTSATLTLHIPSDRFDQALDALSGLGKVVAREQSAEDVTEQVVDLDSRIATQRASVDRVRALLARANTVDEIVRIEQEVTAREAELESLQQRSQALAGQVAMSTVTIRIGRTAAPPAPEPEKASGFLAGLSAGWDAFRGAGAVTLEVIGAVLPFVLALAIPVVAALRWWRRRHPATPAAPVAGQP